jgi:hypothetical protein
VAGNAHRGLWPQPHAQQLQQQHGGGVALHMPALAASAAAGGASNAAASLLAASGAWGTGSQLVGSDFLPTNERDDLSSRVAASQSLLQSFYESRVSGVRVQPAAWVAQCRSP